MVALPATHKKHRRSVHNWVNGNKPVVRSESASFLEAVDDEDFIALNAQQPNRDGFELLFDYIVQSWPPLANNVCTSAIPCFAWLRNANVVCNRHFVTK